MSHSQPPIDKFNFSWAARRRTTRSRINSTLHKLPLRWGCTRRRTMPHLNPHLRVRSTLTFKEPICLKFKHGLTSTPVRRAPFQGFIFYF